VVRYHDGMICRLIAAASPKSSTGVLSSVSMGNAARSGLDLVIESAYGMVEEAL
jgi:hypothetical protein